MQNTNNPVQRSIISLSSLLCEENEHGIFSTDAFDDDDDDDEPLQSVYCNYSIFTVSACEVEYIQILLDREISSSLVAKRSVFNSGNSLRNDSINYILHMRVKLGFGFQTAYLSLAYFDLFLSKRSIDDEISWAIQLLAVACLSLAAKLEEYRVPSLSEFQVGYYNFGSKVIQKMELLVLNTLEWKMGLVTPFAYLPYFINKFCNGTPPKGTASRIIKLLLSILREINLMEHHPYAIASASILVSLDESLSRQEMELKINTILPSKLLDMEDIFTCYNIMNQLDTEKTKVPDLPNSRDISPIDVLHHSPVTSLLGSKRKRLTFDDIVDLQKG